MKTSGKIIAVLYPGEMGVRIASALLARGETVITTLDGRSAQTRRRCEECGIAVRPTLAHVVREADIVLSSVPPAAAEDVARAYAALAESAPPNAIFVDINSVSPRVVDEMADCVEGAGRSFVDAAINGLASRLSGGGTLFLSGTRAHEVGELFAGVTRVRLVGARPGAASAMKMFLSGISKGVCALYLEVALAAQRQGMLEPMQQACAQTYPEVADLIRRMLPTYAEHAERRAEEMRQLESTIGDAGTEPLLASAVRELHEQLSQVEMHKIAAGDVSTLIESLARDGFQSASACSVKE